MKEISPKQYARNLLDRLVSLDDQMTSAYYEMGQVLSAIEHGKLYDTLGYESFAGLIEEEMSFTAGTAGKYLHTYRHFKRLHYTKLEALGLIKEFSFTRVAEYIAQAKTKVGHRAVKTAIQKNLENKRQVNFTVNKQDFELVQKVLRQHGASELDSGRWSASSDAFMDIIVQAAATPPKLQAVG